MRYLVLAVALAATLAGCGEPSFDPNYETKVTLTPEEQAKADANKMDKGPMALDPATGQPKAGDPGKLKVPGK